MQRFAECFRFKQGLILPVTSRKYNQSSIVGLIFRALDLCFNIPTSFQVYGLSNVLRRVRVDASHFDVAFDGSDLTKNAAVAEDHVFGGLWIRHAGEGDVALGNDITGS